MNIDWKKIKEKYPKGYFEFIKILFYWIELKNINEIDLDDEYGQFIEIHSGTIIPFEEICYCDLEKFFDDNGVIIDIGYCYEPEPIYFYVDIYFKNNYKYASYDILYRTRTEAKEKAIPIAFEILEQKKPPEKSIKWLKSLLKNNRNLSMVENAKELLECFGEN
jgi:hypothetical protein